MKPVRGSERPSSQEPNSKKAEKRRQKDPLRSGTSNAVKHTKQNRKGSAPKKVKGQENWKPMSSITALEKMLDLSVLSVLATIKTEKEEVQTHLNTLKKRFLAACVELLVPVRKQGNPLHASRQHQEESTMFSQGKKTLAMLEEDLSVVVNTLEEMEEQTAALEHECTKLRQQLEENEAAQEALLSQRAVLNLPPVPPRIDNHPTLQEKLLDLVPAADRDTTALRLGKALQNGPNQDTLALMKHIDRHTDQHLSPLT